MAAEVHLDTRTLDAKEWSGREVKVDDVVAEDKCLADSAVDRCDRVGCVHGDAVVDRQAERAGEGEANSGVHRNRGRDRSCKAEVIDEQSAGAVRQDNSAVVGVFC